MTRRWLLAVVEAEHANRNIEVSAEFGKFRGSLAAGTIPSESSNGTIARDGIVHGGRERYSMDLGHPHRQARIEIQIQRF